MPTKTTLTGSLLRPLWYLYRRGWPDNGLTTGLRCGNAAEWCKSITGRQATGGNYPADVGGTGNQAVQEQFTSSRSRSATRTAHAGHNEQGEKIRGSDYRCFGRPSGASSLSHRIVPSHNAIPMPQIAITKSHSFKYQSGTTTDERAEQ